MRRIIGCLVLVAAFAMVSGGCADANGCASCCKDDQAKCKGCSASMKCADMMAKCDGCGKMMKCGEMMMKCACGKEAKCCDASSGKDGKCPCGKAMACDTTCPGCKKANAMKCTGMCEHCAMAKK